jgi:hypothetical protein
MAVDLQRGVVGAATQYRCGLRAAEMKHCE